MKKIRFNIDRTYKKMLFVGFLGILMFSGGLVIGVFINKSLIYLAMAFMSSFLALIIKEIDLKDEFKYETEYEDTDEWEKFKEKAEWLRYFSIFCLGGILGTIQPNWINPLILFGVTALVFVIYLFCLADKKK